MIQALVVDLRVTSWQAAVAFSQFSISDFMSINCSVGAEHNILHYRKHFYVYSSLLSYNVVRKNCPIYYDLAIVQYNVYIGNI